VEPSRANAECSDQGLHGDEHRDAHDSCRNETVGVRTARARSEPSETATMTSKAFILESVRLPETRTTMTIATKPTTVMTHMASFFAASGRHKQPCAVERQVCWRR
jgi:hypothetical protein